MSSILKALKKLEQDPTRNGAAMDFRHWKTDPEKADGRSTRHLRPRTLVFYVLFVPFLAVGGWLLLKYAPLLTEKFEPGKPLPPSKGAMATNMSAGVGTAPEKADLGTKASSPPIPRITPRKEKAPVEKTVLAPRTGERIPEKKEEKLPAVVNGAQAITPLKPPAEKLGVKSKSFQTERDPISASGSPSQRDELVLNKDGRSYTPQAVAESSRLTGFSVQAIAWSKIPAERIAVINGVVMREGGFVEGVQVIQIDMDEVSLKKGDKTWRLQCGR